MGQSWHSTTLHVTINTDGAYAIKLVFTRALKESLRFSYIGTTSGPWLAAISPGRVFVAR